MDFVESSTKIFFADKHKIVYRLFSERKKKGAKNFNLIHFTKRPSEKNPNFKTNNSVEYISDSNPRFV